LSERVVPIPLCEVCADIADRAFESNPGEVGKVVIEFLNHVMQNHTEEVLAVLAERYAPIFLAKRSMR
jgi:hypothetical protein